LVGEPKRKRKTFLKKRKKKWAHKGVAGNRYKGERGPNVDF